MNYDCFISHASEDKLEFVDPLANELRRLGLSVWYDRFTLTVGDSISRKIDEGLSEAKYGVLILSKAFMSKPWPEYELRGLIAREVGKDKVILPVWYGISRDEVLKFSPTLADKLAIPASTEEIVHVSRQLIQVIRPDIFENVHRIETYQKLIKSAPVKETPIEEIRVDKHIYHKKLTPLQVIRIRNIRAILLEVHKVSFAKIQLDFKMDINIEGELYIWEGIAATYSVYKELFEPPAEELKEVFTSLILCSLGKSLEEFIEGSLLDYKVLDRSKRKRLLTVWANVPKEVEFNKQF